MTLHVDPVFRQVIDEPTQNAIGERPDRRRVVLVLSATDPTIPCAPSSTARETAHAAPSTVDPTRRTRHEHVRASRGAHPTAATPTPPAQTRPHRDASRGVASSGGKAGAGERRRRRAVAPRPGPRRRSRTQHEDRHAAARASSVRRGDTTAGRRHQLVHRRVRSDGIRLTSSDITAVRTPPYPTTRSPMPDVVLPVLRRSRRHPQCVRRSPLLNVIVVDTADRRLRRRGAAPAAPASVHEPRRGFRPRVRWSARRGPRTSSRSWTATAHSTAKTSSGSARPVVDCTSDLVLGARIAEPGAWPWHLPSESSPRARGGTSNRRPLTDLGPMPRLVGSGCSTSTFATVASDGTRVVLRAAAAAGTSTRSTCRTGASRSLQSDGHGARHDPGRP